MTRNNLRTFLASVLLLALFSAAGPLVADDEDLKTCYYKFTCTYSNGYSVTIRMPGTGETEADAYAQAETYALQARDQCLSMPGTSASMPVQDGCDGPPGPVPPPPPPAAKAVSRSTGTSPMIMLQHGCYTRSGNELSFVSYGPREGLDALSEAVWNSMAVAAAPQGGIAPGTGHTQVEDMFYYYVYQTVRSTNLLTQIHREYTVEGKGTTDLEAQASAAQAAKKIIAQMSAQGELAQTVGAPRGVPIVKVLHSTPTKLCVYRCFTPTGWTVITTDYGLTKPQACNRASATMTHIANDHYGGVINPGEIAPHQQP